MTSHDGGSTAKTVIAGTTVPAAIAAVAILFRFVSRNSSHAIGSDDWLCLVAFVCYQGLFATLLVWASNGKLGWQQDDLTTGQLATSLKISWAVQLLYVSTVTPAKLSFLLFYRRIFDTRVFRTITATAVAASLLWGFVTALTTILSCQPVSAYWQSEEDATCLNQQQFDLGIGITNILLNTVIVIMPVPILWHLEMSIAQKFILLFMFSFGVLIIVASILRTIYLTQVDPSNIPGTITDAAIWTSVEPGIAIVCSCLPTLPHLLSRAKYHSSNIHNEKGSFRSLLSTNASRPGTANSGSEGTIRSASRTSMSTVPSSPRFNTRGNKKGSRMPKHMDVLEKQRMLLNLQREIGISFTPRIENVIEAAPRDIHTIQELDENGIQGIQVKKEFSVHSWSGF